MFVVVGVVVGAGVVVDVAVHAEYVTAAVDVVVEDDDVVVVKKMTDDGYDVVAEAVVA